jgi:NTE family protein
MKNSSERPKTGLILTGGGARAAYQIGVLRAIAEILPKNTQNPFPIICGTSAGAINATVLATYAGNFRKGIKQLMAVWRNFRVNQVYRSDLGGVVNCGARWLAALLVGGLGKYNPDSLLDNNPLQELLNSSIDYQEIQKSITEGHLLALSVTASGYTSGESVSFFQGASHLQAWQRARRLGIPTNIGTDHLMASSAIPFIFPAVKINREYFGDGSMRQIAPISPALHLGAERILVIGSARLYNPNDNRTHADEYPSLAQIAGHALNSLFLDTMEADIELLKRINRTVDMIPREVRERSGIELHHVDFFIMTPSESIETIAARHAHHFPGTIKFLLSGVGAFNREGSNLVSYLLFEKSFCRALIDLGYKDTMERKSELLEFLK